MARSAEYKVPFTDVVIPASVEKQAETQDPKAWYGSYRTVRLLEPIRALRLHGNGAFFPSPDEPVASDWPSGKFGRWFSVGNDVLALGDFQEAASLPHSFPAMSEFWLDEGTILNVGIASRRFHGRRGGMTQAELIGGPRAVLLMDGGILLDRYGNA